MDEIYSSKKRTRAKTIKFRLARKALTRTLSIAKNDWIAEQCKTLNNNFGTKAAWELVAKIKSGLSKTRPSKMARNVKLQLKMQKSFVNILIHCMGDQLTSIPLSLICSSNMMLLKVVLMFQLTIKSKQRSESCAILDLAIQVCVHKPGSVGGTRKRHSPFSSTLLNSSGKLESFQMNGKLDC